LRTSDMETRVTATLTSQYTALPADFLGMKNFQINTNPVTRLAAATADFLDGAVVGSATGKPLFYAVIGSAVQLAPSPDTSYTAEMVYWAKIPALSGTNPTNWLLTKNPDAYLFGTLVEGAGYTSNDADMGKWQLRLDAAIEKLLD